VKTRKQWPAPPTQEQIDSVVAFLRAALADGPRTTDDVAALADAFGLRAPVVAWRRARQLLEVHCYGVGAREHFQLYEWLPFDIEREIGEWLDTPAGKFEAYCAERDRLPLGQLELDLRNSRYG
jgi:hypothetical protein